MPLVHEVAEETVEDDTERLGLVVRQPKVCSYQHTCRPCCERAGLGRAGERVPFRLLFDPGEATRVTEDPIWWAGTGHPRPGPGHPSRHRQATAMTVGAVAVQPPSVKLVAAAVGTPARPV